MGRLPATLADTVSGSGILALTEARLFSGANPQVHERATVIIEDDSIMAIGSIDDGLPDHCAVVDVGGKFVMPGLIDAHAHLSMTEHSPSAFHPPKGAEPRRAGLTGHVVASTLRSALRMGVTTIRDVEAYEDVVLDVRQAMRYGTFIGPRLLACGRIVSTTALGGRFFPGMYREADGADDLRRAVRESRSGRARISSRS